MEYSDNKNILENIHQKSTSELSDGDIIFLKKMGIINGCGGNIRNDCGNMITKIFAKVSEKIAKKLRPVFFDASCDLHDFGYWKGGNEERRKECDRKFYEKILEDIENEYRGNF